MPYSRGSIVSTWIVSALTMILSVESQNNDYNLWMIILVIGFGICRLIRRNVPKLNISPMEYMNNKAPIFSVLYYFILLIITFYIVLNHPEKIDYGSSVKFFIFLFFFTLPFMPLWLNHEVNIYKNANTKPNKTVKRDK